MFRHLLKLIWRRKGRNLMLSLEILVAFVIVFAIAAFAGRTLQLYRLPIGFAYQNMWSVSVSMGEDAQKAPDPVLYDRLVRGLKELPEVEEVAFASFSPFRHATIRSEYAHPHNGTREQTDLMTVSDSFFAAATMQPLAGRWFSAQDNGADATPVVINRRLAERFFGGAGAAVGKNIVDSVDANAKGRQVLRVVGVIEEFRNRGEMMTPTNFILSRFVPETAHQNVQGIMLKVRPGTGRAFEVKLNTMLKSIKNDWSYEIAPLTAMRASMLRTDLIPLMVLAVIASFMLAMVAFGLFGVLWQNTTRRIPEIGLRRAVGASATSIYRTIIAEQVMLSSLAMLVGLVLLVQLPLTGALGDSLGWPVFAGAAVLSMAVIYLLSLLCSLYPGWRASRLSPTEALHYE